MSPKFELIEGRLHHCGRIARILRHDHQRHLYNLKVDVHREIREIFAASYYRRAWKIDGALAGLGGVEGSVLATSGRIWLALSQEALKYPLAIVKLMRAQLDEISLTKKELYTTVIEGDAAAQRLAIYLGFHPDGEGPSGRVYSRAGRRSLVEYISHEPSLRRPAGNSFQIGLVYHPEHV